VRLAETEPRLTDAKRLQNVPFFELLAEDSWCDVYAGELEVRSPGEPTTGLALGGIRSATQLSATHLAVLHGAYSILLE
jgi:hypothetical protein